MPNEPSFTVLICTHNRHEFLERALNALVHLTIEKPDQIVIVNGGDVLSDQVVEKFIGQGNVTLYLVKTVNKNLAASRNVGLPHCTGEIIAMTDDDAEVYPDWVTQMKRLHAMHPEAGAIGGSVIGINSSSSFISRLADMVTFPSLPKPAYVRTLPGVNISYKRAILERVGLQDESLFRGEDVDYNWRIKQLGYEIFYCPDIKVKHNHRPTLKQFLHQHYMYGRAYYLVRRKWMDMYCVYPHNFRCAKDYLKAVHFFVSIFYQPTLIALRLPRWIDKIGAIPILTINQIIWKSGMLYQKWLLRKEQE